MKSKNPTALTRHKPKTFRYLPISSFLSIVLLFFSCIHPPQTIRLDELDLSEMTSGWGRPQINRSIRETGLSIGGQKFDRGVGTHAMSTFLIRLGRRGRFFDAKVGVDNGSGDQGSVVFSVLGDKKVLWTSGVMKKGHPAQHPRIDVRGIDKLGLLVTDGGDGIDYDHADWADAFIEYSGKMPEPARKPETARAEILTPRPSRAPRIHGPKKYGVRPNSPFLYRIPATGDRPMTFDAENLPDGLRLDKNTGIISGRIPKRGMYPVTLASKNDRGEFRRTFTIKVGDTLALTPPMGWNSWYIHYDRVSDVVMRRAADAMIATGMADFGYQYVNIDDCWPRKVNSDDSLIGGPVRDGSGKLLTNTRFPDMEALADYIHSKGLKAGIYISPGPKTCAGYTGSYGYEKQDAETFAEWGFDFLKYDWCSYSNVARGNTPEDMKKPYRKMRDILKDLDRDVVFNLCQYGMGDVWTWGGEMGNCWRTTGDLGNVSGGSMPGFYTIGISNARHWEYARPGAWNDPDYILIGWVGSSFTGGEGEKTRLSPDEQYFYMSMWSLMAAPLIFSGDMDKLDAFTLNVLCNAEVIDIDQDPLGRQAKIVRRTDDELVMVRELEDGSKAVGLFHVTNASRNPSDRFEWESDQDSSKMTITSSELGMADRFAVRDVWRQKNLGTFEKTFEADVPYHGVRLLRITGSSK